VFPAVNPVISAKSASLQSISVSDPQEPLYTEKYISVVEPATLINETRCPVPVATNLYHTSSSDVPLQASASGDCVAFKTVPEVTVPQA
jgi:hypothetical protein